MKIIEYITDLILKKKINDKYNDKLNELEDLFKTQSLRDVLWRIVFDSDFEEPIDEKKRFVIYSKLNKDPDYITLFKSKYSKNYVAYFKAGTDEERNQIKGRMLELLDIMNSMDVAVDRLRNWDEYEKVKQRKIKLSKDIINKFLTNNK